MTDGITTNVDRAFLIGVGDGLESPYDLGVGMTWEIDNGENEAYDTGVNLGQNLMRLMMRVA